jgi:dCTP deaminase
MDGILVSQDLRALVASGAIAGSTPIQGDQIQPSSLDLRLGARAWQLRCSFLPGAEGIDRRIERLALEEIALDPDVPTMLSHDGVYLVELEERLALPEDVWGRANPKSSSGRLDVFVRLLPESGHEFDTLPAGYRGRLYLEVAPQSFHIQVRRGDALGQLRLARGRARLDREALEAVQAKEPVVLWHAGDAARISEGERPGFELSVDLEPDFGRRNVVGYAALRHSPPIDLRHRGYRPERNWIEVKREPRSRWCILQPNEFYIFATRERLAIPAHLCAELVPFDATKGELRTHYAGFIDSGFGCSGDQTVGALGLVSRAQRGARLVLEIRTRDVPFLLEHGQPLFRIELLANRALPDRIYGAGSNYQMQGLKLAKQFRVG